MSKIGKFWTDSVAYVALLVGAGLSIAGNVADTYRTRAAATDELDIVLAVAWPVLVVLMVELFVSTRWVGTGRAMQAIRWVGCLGIGLMAMRVSWVHLNDLLLSRGQKPDVAIIGPLAIDSLAIMATALILSGRVAKRVASVATGHLDSEMASLATQVATDIGHLAARIEDVAIRVQDMATGQTPPLATPMASGRLDLADPSNWPVATRDDMAMTLADLMASRQPGHDGQLATPVDILPEDSGPGVGQEIEDWLANFPMATPPVVPGPVARPVDMPGYAKNLLVVWDLADRAERPPVGDVDELLAAEFGKSTRVIRRWRTALGIKA